MKTKNGIVFLLYDSRSGSTLLSSLLDAYADIGVTIESNFMLNLIRLKGWFEKTGDSEGLFRRLENLDRFRNLNIEFDDFIRKFNNKKKNIASFAECILETYFARDKPQAQAWVVKDGHNGYYINQIFHELPNARFIHIIRDGRAVLNSRMRTIRPYGRGESMARDPLTAARLWKKIIEHIDSFEEKHPESVLDIRYEDLVTQTKEEIKRVRAYLHLESSEVAELSHMKIISGGYYGKIPEREKNIHDLITKSPDIMRLVGWKDELPSADRILFEYAAWDTLTKKNYGLDSQITFSWILREPDLRKLFFLSYMLRAKSWLSYIFDRKLLLKMVYSKWLMWKEK